MWGRDYLYASPVAFPASCEARRLGRTKSHRTVPVSRETKRVGHNVGAGCVEHIWDLLGKFAKRANP